MTTKQLNGWQAKWAKFLLEFNFKVTYRLKKSEQPDMLTSLSYYRLKRFDNLQQQHQFYTVLKASQLNEDIKKTQAVMFYTNFVDKADKVNV